MVTAVKEGKILQDKGSRAYASPAPGLMKALYAYALGLQREFSTSAVGVLPPPWKPAQFPVGFPL